MAFYVQEILLTLEYLHSKKIIYRDLKPENIVISMMNKGHIKIVDFGFAKQLKSLSAKTTTMCGTPAYIAPEIVRGQGHGFEVDIWSLGILIFEMLTGQTPFKAENSMLVYKKISACQMRLPMLIPEPIQDLLKKILVSDPKDRLTIA